MHFSNLNLFRYVLNNALTHLDFFGLFDASMQFPPADANTIVCQGNIAVPHLSPREQARNSRCVNTCIRIHEQSHADDANVQGACQGMMDGVVVLVSSNEERVQSEIKAYQAELKCLQIAKAMAAANPNGNDLNDCECRTGNVNSYFNTTQQRLQGWQNADPKDTSTWPKEN